MKKRNKQAWMTALVAAGLAMSVSAVVYDDFSSGDLSKWIFTPGAPPRTDPQVVSNALVWTSSATPAFLNETLVSTQIGFDLSSAATSTVQLTVADIIPRSSADTSYDSFGFGWQDETGDYVILRYSWRADSTNDNSVLQVLYAPGGSSAVALGGNFSSSGYLVQNGDILKLAYIKDANRIEIYRERAGLETFLFGRTSAALTNLAANARIYLARNDEGLGSSITVDDVSTTPGATSGASLVLYQDTFSSDGTLSGRSAEIGFGAKWQTHVDMASSVGVARPGATASAKVAALPFTPESGKIYTLSTDIDASNAASGQWSAMGFLAETNSATINGTGYFFAYVDTQAPWMNIYPNGTVSALAGPAGGNSVAYPGTGSNGTLKIVLDTSATNWIATYYFNGTALRTNSFAGSLAITHVAFGAYPSPSVLDVAVDNFKLEVASGLSSYEQWVASWGVNIGAQTNDFDGDGLDNLAEYGLGGDPTSAADTGIPPAYGIAQVGGTNWLTYAYPMRTDPSSGIAYHLETTDDLVFPAWTNAYYETTGTGATAYAGFDAVTNRISTGTKAKQFIRLIIETL